MWLYDARMGRGVSTKVRGVVTGLALASLAFHVALLSWHITSRFAAQVLAADLGLALTVICHAGQAAGGPEGDPNSAPDVPPAIGGGCPVCKGIAGLHLAVVAVVLLGPSAPPRQTFAAVADERVAWETRLTPRSRGPPLLS